VAWAVFAPATTGPVCCDKTMNEHVAMPALDTTKGSGFRLALALFLALLPAIAGIWASPFFLTQDGPAHLYNAEILAHSFDPNSPFRAAYAIRWDPLPNWAGHLLFLGLDVTLPAWAAERTATTLSLVALACATAWLRARVVGCRSAVATAAFAALIGLNVTWLLGFTSFLLGAALFPLTLAVWWGGHVRLTRRRTLALAGLIVLGYFCHPIGLGLTAFGLLTLAALTPGEDRRRRLGLTLLALSPLLPLGWIYRGLTRAGGPMRPEWAQLTNPFSIEAWKEQLRWVDPISLAAKVYRPFGSDPSVWNGLAAPVVWLTLALVALTLATLRAEQRDRRLRGWAVLALALVLGGVLGPDTLGVNHGHYLPQRVFLLGLVALVPWLRLEGSGRLKRLGRAGLVLALVLQTLFVWDYGRECSRTAGRFLTVAPHVGRGQREATVLIDIRGRFRANPLLHVDCLLGVGTGNIIWANYESNYYYFPVQRRDPEHTPSALDLEALALLGGPTASERAAKWSDLLDRSASAIDVVVIYGNDPEIERITGRQFVLEFRSDDGVMQVWRRAKP
jgi:hypothetical protein